MRRPRWPLVAALVALPLLAGCDLDARVSIAADDTVTVDGTGWVMWRVTDENGQDVIDDLDPCQLVWNPSSLLTSRTLRDPADKHHVGCHVTGTVALKDLAAASGLAASVLHRDGRYEVLMGAQALRWAGMDPSAAAWDADVGTFHVEVTFPGAVTGHDASATVAGNTVIWENRGARALGGAWATSLEEGRFTTATWAQVAALGGLAVGAAGMSAAWLLRGSRRRDGDPLEPDVADRDRAESLVRAPSARADADVSDDPSVWAPRQGDSGPDRAADDTSEWAPDADR